MVYSWASFSWILYKVQSTTFNQYFDTYLFIVLSILLRYCIIRAYSVIQVVWRYRIIWKRYQNSYAYVQQFHRCLFIESTIIDDFFDQVSIVRGIFFLIKIEQQTKVSKKESFEAIFFLTRKKKLKLLEIALNFDAFLSLNFVSRTHEGIANCEIEWLQYV